jgi:tRNA(fMet)-specific endonuclease VapC
MRKFVLDTNILLAYVRQSPPYLSAETALNLSADDAQLIVSAVSIAEIRVLAQRNNWGEKKLELLNRFFEETLLVVDVSIGAPELLDAYVDIEVVSTKIGRKMGKNDLWIAATAKVTDSTLISTDGDFDHLNKTHLSVFKIV